MTSCQALHLSLVTGTRFPEAFPPWFFCLELELNMLGGGWGLGLPDPCNSFQETGTCTLDMRRNPAVKSELCRLCATYICLGAEEVINDLASSQCSEGFHSDVGRLAV